MCHAPLALTWCITIVTTLRSITPDAGAGLHFQRLSPEELITRLAAIVDSCEDAIVAKDLNGVVTDWNVAAEHMFGYTAQEMIGRSILTLIPPELQHEEPAILGKIRAGERLEHYETY